MKDKRIMVGLVMAMTLTLFIMSVLRLADGAIPIFAKRCICM